jgi:holo-[acyl-carrier protein] synthase
MHVGIDLADVDEVRNSMRTLGDRYLQRVYTDAERRDCGGDVARLAERFAAKEATMKALGCPERLAWQSVEVVRDASGAATLALSGAAAEIAHERGMNAFTVSLARTAAHGAAVVVGRAG